jgi:hypothetical protein
MIRVRRDASLPSEVVRGAERQHAERNVVSVEAIHDLIERPVSSGGDDGVDATARGRARERFGVSALEGDVHGDRVPAAAHPVDEVTEIVAAGPGAVNDECDVLTTHLTAEFGSP